MSDTTDSDRSVLDAAKRWAEFFETLTPSSLDRLESLCAPEVRFRDPFNDHTGVDAVRRVFETMFDTLEEPRFSVTRIAVDGDTAFLSWFFTFKRANSRKAWRIEGVSEVIFDETGRVTAHLDHWDASQQFYAKLPLIGAMIRFIAAKVGV